MHWPTTGVPSHAKLALVAVLHKEQLGKRIKARREELGLTQKGLAELAHIKEGQTVSRWERGEREPSDLSAVATALQYGSVSEMLVGIEMPEKERLRVDPAGKTQLDRIEQKVDELLEAVRPLSQLDERLRLLETDAEAAEWEAGEQGEGAGTAKAPPRRRQQR